MNCERDRIRQIEEKIADLRRELCIAIQNQQICRCEWCSLEREWLGKIANRRESLAEEPKG